MSFVGRLVGLDRAFSGKPAAGSVALPLMVGAAGSSAWPCGCVPARQLSIEGNGVWLPWFGGFPAGALASAATRCELEFETASAGLPEAVVPSALGDGDGDVGFCGNSELTSKPLPFW